MTVMKKEIRSESKNLLPPPIPTRSTIRPSKDVAPAKLSRDRSTDGYMSSFQLPKAKSETTTPSPLEHYYQYQKQQREQQGQQDDVQQNKQQDDVQQNREETEQNRQQREQTKEQKKQQQAPPIHPLKTRPPMIARAASTSSIVRKPHHRRESSAPQQWYEESDDATLEDWKEILKSRRQLLGDDHVNVGYCYNHIGNCHYRRGEFLQAESSYMAALQVFFRQITSGSESSFAYSLVATNHSQIVKEASDSKVRWKGVATTLSNLGAIYWRTGRSNDAVRALDESLDIHYRVCQNNDSNTDDTNNDYLHDLEEGKLGPSHRNSWTSVMSIETATKLSSCPQSNCTMDIAVTFYNLGIAHCLCQNYDLSIATLKRCQAIQTEIFGTTTHIEVARTMDTMGRVYLQMDHRLEDARNCYCEALRVKRVLLGPRHASVNSSLRNAAMVFQRMGDTSNAIVSWNEILKSQRFQLRMLKSESRQGNNNRNNAKKSTFRAVAQEYATSLHTLGDLWIESGDLKKGQDCLSEAVKVYVRECGLTGGLEWKEGGGIVVDESVCDSRIVAVRRSQERMMYV